MEEYTKANDVTLLILYFCIWLEDCKTHDIIHHEQNTCFVEKLQIVCSVWVKWVRITSNNYSKDCLENQTGKLKEDVCSAVHDEES